MLLFFITYTLLFTSLKRQQDLEVQSRLLEFWALYQINGIDLLEKEVFVHSYIGRGESFLIRVSDAHNNTLFLYLPAKWPGFDPESLESIDFTEDDKPVRLHIGSGREIVEFASLRLPDKNLLQIGFSIEDRLEVLARFRRIYLIVVVPLISLSFAGGLFFSFRSLKPIHDLIRVTRSIIETGEINTRIPSKGTGDELDTLILLFNRMLQKMGMRDALDNVAHDLRTPMTRLVGKAEMALKSSGEPRLCREALSDCIKESESMLTLLNTIMDISEAETGAMKLDRKVIDLSSLLTDMVELYRYPAEEKDVSVAVNISDNLQVLLDVNRLRQVIANLLDNAIKYTPPKGTIKIEAFCIKNHAVVRIKNTGTEIPEDELERIWDRFYRSDRNMEAPGLGLGLSLVKAIVEAHEGSVAVNSTPGEGTVFSFKLPMPV
jgi:signal transduction histidine kinase